ncbi:MAG: ATP-binding protein [Pseudomonadota bacterium]|nr:ATP-binding protein [Pseudomonadota bacterium]
MPPIGETIARRRVFWFLIVLVVGPTLALAFYGLTGLKDQRDATEARLRERYMLQARVLEGGIIARLAEEDALLRQALARQSPEGVSIALATIIAESVIIRDAWVVGDEGAPRAVEAAAEGLSANEPVTFVSTEDGGGLSTVAVSRVREGLTIGYRIDPDAIDAVIIPALVGRQFPSERAQYGLRAATREQAGEPVSFERLRRNLAENLAESEPMIDRAMAPPFEQWRITVVPPLDTGPGSSAAIIWTVLLLAATTVTGVILMGRAVVQQVRLSRLQTDFVSNISHELRTPLTSIRLFIETLQSGRVKDPEKVRECLDIIATESERLTRKIERVLTWARMEAGRRTYEFELVRPVDLVRSSLEAFRAQQLHGEAKVSLLVPEDLPLVRVDTDAMADSLLNLLSNARKYGGEDVHIRVLGAVERRWVVLTVADDGPGIPRDERKRIFEKFYRPDVLVSRRTEGSGLGLAIVHAAVLAHKGRVDVESEEGRGARFTVRLPRA